ncbi:MAG TPA: hypothetical protein VFS00_21745 [Polyangiaceae bacterium]|nr:hypothetical protein [Polyangiaceae bacterium]
MLAHERGLAVDEAHVEDGLAVAELAGNFHLFDAVGELEQALRALEEAGLKVGAQAVANHRHVVAEGDAPQLLDERGREKLRLVDEHAVQALEEREVETGVGLDQQVGRGLEPRARDDALARKAVVEPRLDQQHPLALRAVVVGHRQQVQRLGRAHRAVPKVKLGHTGRVARPGAPGQAFGAGPATTRRFRPGSPGQAFGAGLATTRRFRPGSPGAAGRGR